MPVTMPSQAPEVHRIGLIVPSSNTTMETEVPELLRRHARSHGTAFTFHSSRARLHTVDVESLHAMVEDGARCAAELGDAAVDVIGYACLVALMAEGDRAHEPCSIALREAAVEAGSDVDVVTSAGALVDTLLDLGLRRVSIVTPYLPRLTELVIGYLAAYGIEVQDSISLSIVDNLAVGRLDPLALQGRAARLDVDGVDGVVLSACVQMPSLPAVGVVEQQLGLPVVTAATATARGLLSSLGLKPTVSGAGAALGSSVSS